MKIRFQLLPKGVEDAVFKAVPEGWLFTTQSPWFFAPRRTYIVDNAQKAALAARVRRARYARLIALLVEMPIWVALIIHYPWLLSLSPLSWVVFGAMALAMGVVFALIDYLSVRTLIRGLPRTDQKIRALDMWRTQSRALSVRALVLLTGCELVAAVATLASAFSNRSVLSAVSAGVSLAFAVLFGSMLIAKLRVRSSLGDGVDVH